MRPAARAPMMKPTPIAVSAMPNSPDEACRSRVTKNTFSALIAPVPHWQITVTVSSVTRNRLRAKSRRPAEKSAYKPLLPASAGAGERVPGASRRQRIAR
jgi:hypothetical protein